MQWQQHVHTQLTVTQEHGHACCRLSMYAGAYRRPGNGRYIPLCSVKENYNLFSSASVST